MTTKDLAYPVIAFRKQGPVEVMVDEDTLTTATARDLKIGWFDGSILVDSEGKTAKVKNSKFVAGKGLFWGYTIFLDRIIRVELVLEESAANLTLEDVRNRVLREMKSRLRNVVDKVGWSEEIDKVSKAQTIRELIEIILPYRDARVVFAELWKL